MAEPNPVTLPPPKDAATDCDPTPVAPPPKVEAPAPPKLLLPVPVPPPNNNVCPSVISAEPIPVTLPPPTDAATDCDPTPVAPPLKVGAPAPPKLLLPVPVLLL